MLKQSLIVLGMHRSGTSCLAGSLQEMGLYLGKVHEWNPFNKKGNRENQQVMDLNDAVLAYNNAAWDKVPVAELSWTSEHVVERERILSVLKSLGSGLMGSPQPSGLWGFKDPRTLLVLDFWRDGIEDFDWIGTFRHPIAVGNSLRQRSGMPLEEGVGLWLEYNKRLLTLCQKTENPRLLCFDQSSEEYQKELYQLLSERDLFGQMLAETSFFTSDLRHQSSQSENFQLNRATLQTYRDLHAIYRKQFV